ncbi:MAG: c-type cytochrome [Opitutaceae bacterium]|nr:c-type cytochrome [Opitutaceae bacterium]
MSRPPPAPVVVCRPFPRLCDGARIPRWRHPARSLFALFALAGIASAQPSPLPPAQLLLPEPALPAYEHELDHAGLIRSWGKASLERGERIFEMVCHSCHGDANLRGSLPEALAFTSGKFQHGADPHRMYQTVTRGWRMMPPQVQLVPQEKYDVIHYIRETFLARHNPEQLFAVTPAYLAALPAGKSRGPAAKRREPWREMDYGKFLIGTYELSGADDRAAAAQFPAAERDRIPPGANIAYKGIAIRLDRGPGGIAEGSAWVVFEHDTMRLAGAWTGSGFIDWEGINFNTRHVVRPRTIGDLQFELADGPGWANPETGRFDDVRVVGADGRRFGPLPRQWMHYMGLNRAEDRIVISYTVGDATVRESHDLERPEGQPLFVRTLNIGRSSRDLLMRVANAGTAVAVRGPKAAVPGAQDGFVTLRIPASATPVKLALWLAKSGTSGLDAVAGASAPPRDLEAALHASPAHWPETLSTPIIPSDSAGPFAWARFTLPLANPWRSRLRLTGLDFLPDGHSAVLCTWDGDVWRVDGIDQESGNVTWRRIAAGLFQPLGIKLRDGDIFVTCRDQLVRLRDLNGDGETDFYESYNSDHQVTEHFHEFAMGLQIDPAGNFYYAKSARHARTALVPHHGTLLRIAADGSNTEILANGFRAANGVCLNPDGSFFVTDQEGHWTPMNRINRVVPGRFYGNMWSYGAPADASDSAMAQPLCWIDKGFDRSPAELVRVDRDAWGSLQGELLNLSYGRGRIEVVLQDRRNEQGQGAVCSLPLPDFPTGLIRGRVHPRNADLYLCGLAAWATSQTQQEGGFYRLRRTGRPACLPIAWHIGHDAIELTFSDPPQSSAANDISRYQVRAYGLTRSANYGSPHVDEHAMAVTRAELLSDGRTIRLTVPNLHPTAGIDIVCRLVDANGDEVERVITGTIHHVPPAHR